MIANSILMTVFNRPQRMLINTLEALSKNDLKGCEVIIGDDGSRTWYSEVHKWCEQSGLEVKWINIDPRDYPDDTFRIPHKMGGFSNNPSLAWNRVVAASSGRRLIFLSSDCMIPNYGIRAAKGCGDSYWVSNVVDMHTNRMFVDNIEPRPWPFFASVKREHFDAVGGMDEGFLCGSSWEDNDFAGRIGLYCKHMIVDAGVLAFHQYHEGLPEDLSREGWVIAQEYIRKKWGGTPWRGDDYTDPIERDWYTNGTQRCCNIRMKEGDFIDPLDGKRC